MSKRAQLTKRRPAAVASNGKKKMKVTVVATSAAQDLPLDQVQAMLRLVGETAELWYDPKLQRRYMLESLCRLLDSRAGVCFSFGDCLTGGSQSCGAVVDAGFDEAQRDAMNSYLASGQPLDPALSELMNISPDAGRTAAATVI